MNAMKNTAHAAILALWAVAGLLFSIKVLFGAAPALLLVLSFWAWFAGFLALTSWVVGKLKGPLPAIGTHAAAFFVLHLIPKVLPFSLLRLGLDLLTGNA
jgi:hypothetical protein